MKSKKLKTIQIICLSFFVFACSNEKKGQESYFFENTLGLEAGVVELYYQGDSLADSSYTFIGPNQIVTWHKYQYKEFPQKPGEGFLYRFDSLRLLVNGKTVARNLKDPENWKLSVILGEESYTYVNYLYTIQTTDTVYANIFGK